MTSVMPPHDPADFANGLGSKLSARTRHVCAFLGAGSSKACGLPDIAELEALVLGGLPAGQKQAFERQLDGRNLEQSISRVRRIHALLADGKGSVDDLDAGAAAVLDTAVCAQIVEHLTATKADLAPVLRFAAWAAQADYALPLELFTVNYDLLLETALEDVGVPYFDGFVGSLRARFRTDLVEAAPGDGGAWLPSFLVRLWKLHGSVSWQWAPGETTEVLRLGTTVPTGSPAAIYPSDTKYDESRRVPFVVLQDRFRRALQTNETLVLITGYSWSDAHLNEMLFDAAKQRPRTEFVSFSYSTLPDTLVEKALALPNIQAVGATEAVLGGIRAGWKTGGETIPDAWEGDRLLLGDFAHLAAFLARSAAPHPEIDQRVAALLTSLASGA